MGWRVEAPARLHLGFTSTGDVLTPWLGIGLAVEEPRTVVEARWGGRPGVAVSGDVWPEAVEVAGAVYEELGTEAGVEVAVLESPPRHVGLGTSTQLYLSILRSMALLAGKRPDESVLVRRGFAGRFSWVGIAAFKSGGFVLDLGVGAGGRRSFLSLRFPEDWVVLLARPRGRYGHPRWGEAEKMLGLRYGPDRELGLCRLLFQQILPGVLERDLALFGEGLSRYQRIVGEAFAHLQGGVFNPHSAPVIAAMEEHGLLGAGQSSWGPTCYGFTESQKRAEEVKRLLAESYSCEAWVTRANNQGARAFQTAT
jgi:beta-ribofuranosylaminobenzene 5'-phosphate synthase